jgi:hypothetical protein
MRELKRGQAEDGADVGAVRGAEREREREGCAVAMPKLFMPRTSVWKGSSSPRAPGLSLMPLSSMNISEWFIVVKR